MPLRNLPVPYGGDRETSGRLPIREGRRQNPGDGETHRSNPRTGSVQDCRVQDSWMMARIHNVPPVFGFLTVQNSNIPDRYTRGGPRGFFLFAGQLCLRPSSFIGTSCPQSVFSTVNAVHAVRDSTLYNSVWQRSSTSSKKRVPKKRPQLVTSSPSTIQVMLLSFRICRLILGRKVQSRSQSIYGLSSVKARAYSP
jgi:hypothetical protein